MTFTATVDTVRAIGEVLEFAAILDDRAPHGDAARIAAWAEQAQRHNLGREDLLDGLQAFYDIVHDRPIGISDLLAHAKTIRRDRHQRTHPDNRWHRDVAAPDTPAINPTPRKPGSTDRLRAAERALQCCVDKATSQAAMREYREARREAAELAKQHTHGHEGRTQP